MLLSSVPAGYGLTCDLSLVPCPCTNLGHAQRMQEHALSIFASFVSWAQDSGDWALERGLGFLKSRALQAYVMQVVQACDTHHPEHVAHSLTLLNG